MNLLIAALSVMALLAAPAHAHQPPGRAQHVSGYTFRFGAPPHGAVPCAIVCAYWIDNGFAPCENPFPPGSHVEFVTEPAPAVPQGKVAVIETTLDPEIDWDSFICSYPDRRELSSGANILGEPCGWGPWWLCLGLHEDAGTVVVEGQRVIFAAYNWSDAFDAAGRSWIVFV